MSIKKVIEYYIYIITLKISSQVSKVNLILKSVIVYSLKFLVCQNCLI
jgi:hypothetical protein